MEGVNAGVGGEANLLSPTAKPKAAPAMAAQPKPKAAAPSPLPFDEEGGFGEEEEEALGEGGEEEEEEGEGGEEGGECEGGAPPPKGTQPKAVKPGTVPIQPLHMGGSNPDSGGGGKPSAALDRFTTVLALPPPTPTHPPTHTHTHS